MDGTLARNRAFGSGPCGNVNFPCEVVIDPVDDQQDQTNDGKTDEVVPQDTWH